VHHPNPDIPVKETFKALDELVTNGKIRRYGVSNFNVKQMEEARQYAKHPIVANQIEYNLQARNNGIFNQNMEKEIIPYCVKNNILVVAWRPLVKGDLNQESELLQKLSEKYRCTPNQLAIAWLINKPQHATIAKATSEDHIRENFAAADIALEANDMKLLDQLNN
jgi:diketogulonate reductase-like aldo/keto reductase